MVSDEISGIILAGGKGTRLAPLTEITNKHLLPVGKEPMIWHAVKQLTGSGIRDILVITSTHHMGDVVNSLGSGNRFKCRFTYRVQEEAGGIAHALSLGERFSAGKRIAVFLGDNIFENSIKRHVEDFLSQKKGARVLLKKVSDAGRFGVAALDEEQVISIEEKPREPKSDFAVVGCYMYDNNVFNLIKTLKPSSRGELEITAVNNMYIKRNELQYGIVKGHWTDAGTFDSLHEANTILLEKNNKISI